MIILNKYRVVNEKRFGAFISLLVLISCLTVFLVISSFTKAYSTNNEVYDLVNVKQGDTIWGIATSYDHEGSIDEFIYKIKELNDLKDYDIYPGQQLYIPLN